MNEWLTNISLHQADNIYFIDPINRETKPIFANNFAFLFLFSFSNEHLLSYEHYLIINKRYVHFIKTKVNWLEK